MLAAQVVMKVLAGWVPLMKTHPSPEYTDFGSARSRLATHWALEAHAALQLAMVAVVAFQM